jgi:uncharacterized protein YndB with AHSA1/START domain
MAEPKIVHSTFVIERSFSKTPAAVFASLSNPEKVRRWFAEGEGHDMMEFTSDFREGGRQLLQYRMKPGTPIAGAVITNEGMFQQIVPNERIVAAQTMKFGDHCFSASLITFELIPTDKGTDLVFTDQGAFFEHADGPEMRKAGWTALLDKLAEVVNG